MQTLFILFLQAGDGGSIITFYMPIALMFMVFYFFMIRPQHQKQKKQDAFLQDLEKGSKVVTTSGILGKITDLKGDIITLEIGPKSIIRITRGAISKELTDQVYAKTEE